ncbi:hypothetical protein HHK36_016057 [Tetracentron sinense]|uniref:Sororin C-terminal region domain-containing protein n=1 Tax=Tetracentron sinense TaxID=13715 RepID=A0A834Z042_TETSI|nr:hypothetical protein HHK36_016057 [Tetracentron sinense]
MEVEKRSLKKRKPLSDCTNIIASSVSATSSSLIKPKISSLTAKKPDETSFKYDTSIGSNVAENPRTRSQPSTPAPQKFSANSDTLECEKSELVTVYSRRQTAEKRKIKGKAIAMAIPSSCPPAGRVRHIGRDKLSEEHGDVGLSKSDKVPHPKYKKKRHHSLSKLDVDTPGLPQDFINQQRAYFAEIDAFELPEEVVSESELE